MSTPNTDAWGRLRQLFAEQFEPWGTGFVYRRSQKGEAISVSTQERDRFIEEFDRGIRRSKWILYVALTLVFGAIVAFVFLKDGDQNLPVIYVAIVLGMVPYLLYYRWAWGAPARELGSRTPVAGERPRDEVQRLYFQRITYGQLLTAALGGLALPIIGSTHQDIFSGWSRLWLVSGGALVLLAAVQTFRKWRFEQDGSYRNVISPQASVACATADEDPKRLRFTDQFWRYTPFVLGLAGFAFISLTPAGKELATQPRFWPLIVLVCAAWALITVARGFTKGRIEPFARGFYTTYERDSQPKRYWASMAWNTMLGCGMVALAYQVNNDATVRILTDKCEQAEGLTPALQQIKACDDWLALKPYDADAYFNRGLLYMDVGALDKSVADFTSAHDLATDNPLPLANRGVAWALEKNESRAEADFDVVRSIDPSNPVMLRGEALLRRNAGDNSGAVGFLTASMKRDPDNIWALQTRAELYWQLGEQEKSAEDDRRYRQLIQAARARSQN